MGVLAVCNTYLVDVMQDRSAEVIATNKYAIIYIGQLSPLSRWLPSIFSLYLIFSCLRYIASAGASSVVLPLIQSVGIAATNAIATVFALTGFALICATIKYGKCWRESGEMEMQSMGREK